MRSLTLSRFTWGVLGYCALVLIFGAFVRASYSGDGCGASWPMCGETFVPQVTSAPRAIELTHRLSSGLLSLLTLGLYLWARKCFEKQHPARKAALVAAVSTLVSALIGAVLVLARWVTNDKSAGRAITMPLHLVNNYLLLAALIGCAFWASGGKFKKLKEQGALANSLYWAFGSMFVLGATGAFSALGKTAFEHELAPVKNFAERMWLHVGPQANPILRGGVLHPLIATSVGLLLLWVCGAISHQRPSKEVRSLAKITIGIYAFQMILGLVNLYESAPIPMQLFHLSVAIANWISLVLLALTAVASDARPEVVAESKTRETSTQNSGFVAKDSGKPTWKDYLAMTKPRVISLLLFTTVAAMFIANHGMPNVWLILWVCIGGYAAAGAANTYNMVAEEDLDLAMERTSHRPTVTHKISKKKALIFANVLAIGSFLLLWGTANLLTAILSLCGLLCYVFVYTLWLKRRTWHNIVIGGAAGAFPPLVGWASITGSLSPLAWFLFALVFLWTPVHFWALALLIKDDYAKAGVPMLPVVKGDRVTVNQIGLYAILSALICVMPIFQANAGPIYWIGSLALNFGLILQSLRLWKTVDRPHARALFKYSMVYLALFFVIIAMDQARYI